MAEVILVSNYQSYGHIQTPPNNVKPVLVQKISTNSFEFAIYKQLWDQYQFVWIKNIIPVDQTLNTVYVLLAGISFSMYFENSELTR